jgi:hypothetical protein
MKLTAELTESRQLIYDRNEFSHGLKKLKAGNVIIEIKGEKAIDEFKKRTDKENKYYWGVVIKHAIEGFKESYGEWFDRYLAHEKLKENCNGKISIVTSRLTGEQYYEKVGLSTKDLSTVEFEAYLARCRSFLHEWHNCSVPLPNENEPVEYL